MLQFKSVSKSFQQSRVIDRINISVQKGNCICLIGPNGSGKSTILNIAMGLLKQDEGIVKIAGLEYSNNKKIIYEKLGCLPEKSLLIEEISGHDFLRFHGILFSIDAKTLNNRIDDLVKFFFEDQKSIGRDISTYSVGMKRRLEICTTLLTAPEILILDEPFSSLDPVFCYRLILLIKEYVLSGKTVIISSHDLLYVKEISTKIILLSEGKIVYDGNAIDFFDDQMSELESFLDYLPGIDIKNDTSESFPLWLK